MYKTNLVMLEGNLGADPEQRTSTQSGQSMVSARLATNETWRDRQSGERKERTEWHRLVFYGWLADAVMASCRKGTRLLVEGRIQTRKWTDPATGQDRWTTEVVCNDAAIIDRLRPPPKDGHAHAGGQGHGMPPAAPDPGAPGMPPAAGGTPPAGLPPAGGYAGHPPQHGHYPATPPAPPPPPPPAAPPASGHPGTHPGGTYPAGTGHPGAPAGAGYGPYAGGAPAQGPGYTGDPPPPPPPPPPGHAPEHGPYPGPGAGGPGDPDF